MSNWNLKLKTILFTLLPLKMKYLGINLTKYVFVPKTFMKKTTKLLKDIKEGLNKWKDISHVHE